MSIKRWLYFLVLLSLAGWSTGCGSTTAFDAQNVSNLARMVFATQPQTQTLGTNMGPIRLEGRDQFDQIIAISGGTVELSLENNPTGAQLLDNGNPVVLATQSVSGGQATFNNLRVDKVGTGYTLKARYQVPGTDLVFTAISNSFDVTTAQVTSVFYLRSDQDLWGSAGAQANLDALQAAFGAGNFTEGRFESSVPADVFQGNRLVYMDGGDNGATEMATFLTANADLMRTFVQNGGRVIVNAAPNENGNITTPFNATINYDNNNTSPFQSDSVDVDPLHPIGVACNGTLQYTGNSFGHALVTATDMTPIITRTPPPPVKALELAEAVVLAEGRLGSGLFLVGGMTTSNFHKPSEQARTLRANILRYAGGLPLVPAGPVVTKQEAAPAGSSRD